MAQMDTDILEERIIIPGGPVPLAGRIAYPSSGQPGAVALIAGAHPLLGGHTENNIVDTVRTRLAAAGAMAMSFDYRGINRDDGSALDWQRMISEFWNAGRVPEEQLWLDDAEIAMTHCRALLEVPIVLVGYSFGGWIVSRLAERTTPAAVICISPNPAQHDLGGLDTSDMPRLVISSDNDFSCSPEDMRNWLSGLSGEVRHVLLPGAEHFFRQRESDVADAAVRFLIDIGLFKAHP